MDTSEHPAWSQNIKCSKASAGHSPEPNDLTSPKGIIYPLVEAPVPFMIAKYCGVLLWFSVGPQDDWGSPLQIQRKKGRPATHTIKMLLCNMKSEQCWVIYEGGLSNHKSFSEITNSGGEKASEGADGKGQESRL